MNRRAALTLPLLGAAVATGAAARSPCAHLPEADALVEAMIEEVRVFRCEEGDDEEKANAAVGRSYDAGQALLALPTRAQSHPDFLPAIALWQRRWLVMEGDYEDPEAHAVCMLVDAALAGTRFDAVPMLWHVGGHACDQRPSERVFAAARASAMEARR